MVEYMQKENTIQKKKEDHIRMHDNSTGIPDHMKAYAEKLYGTSLDDVRVHYNSENPSQFNALGYTQKNNVYLGPGQEKHLMHELCHVIQQKRGIVKPTSREGGLAINDSVILEKEAEYCEKQYENETPIQMLRKQAAQGSNTMRLKGLDPKYSDRYHVLGYYNLKCNDGHVAQDAVWSNKESYERREKGGDHAEDVICDYIELMGFVNYLYTFMGKVPPYVLEGGKLNILLSSSPCKRCQERLNQLASDYHLKINVLSAKEYGGTAGGGAGDAKNIQYELTILSNEKDREFLLQF